MDEPTETPFDRQNRVDPKSHALDNGANVIAPRAEYE